MVTIGGDVPSGSGVGFAFVSQPIPPIQESATLLVVSQPISSTPTVSQVASIAWSQPMI